MTRVNYEPLDEVSIRETLKLLQKVFNAADQLRKSYDEVPETRLPAKAKSTYSELAYKLEKVEGLLCCHDYSLNKIFRTALEPTFNEIIHDDMGFTPKQRERLPKRFEDWKERREEVLKDFVR